MSKDSTRPNRDRAPRLWWAIALALVALRLFHLAGPLDDPHSWRQCDTVYYSLDFFRHGIDLLYPAVCWLGGHRTLIFEFPIAEALSALLYRTFGPDPMWDRLVSLAFFLVSAAYLHALARMFAGAHVARLAALAWLALPLGQFYSRAAHVDFVATAFAHAWLFHALRALRGRSFAHGAAAAGCGTLAALIKMPYLVPVAFPLLAVGVASLVAAPGATVALGALAGAVPAVAFAIWRRHVDGVNAAAPDWSFIPGYYKEVNPLWWYVGSWAQRLDPSSWMRLARRLGLEVVTPIGALIATLAALRPAHSGTGLGARAFTLLWGAGAVFYLLVFYPLNVIHNYYQIPFLAPAALAIGLGADALWRRLPPVYGAPLGAVVFAVFLGGAVWLPGRLGYYQVDWVHVEAGRMLDARVPPGDLIVATGHDGGHSDPRLLLRADRDGWGIEPEGLTPERVERLSEIGARWIAYVAEPDDPDPPAFLEDRIDDRRPILHDGRTIGTLHLYALEGAVTRPGTGEAGASGAR